MRIASMDLAPELFVSFCQASKDGPPRYFRVKENPLPDDARVVAVAPLPDRYPMLWRLFIASDSFEDVPQGSVPPELPLVVYETVYTNEPALHDTAI